MKIAVTERRLKLEAADLIHRRPVWEAMSDLFLDTELEQCRLAQLAKTLRASPYSMDEIESILYREVYPVLIRNLLSFCGEWLGVCPEALEAEILSSVQRKWSLCCFVQLNRWMIRDDWNRVKEFYEAGGGA